MILYWKTNHYGLINPGSQSRERLDAGTSSLVLGVSGNFSESSNMKHQKTEMLTSIWTTDLAVTSLLAKNPA